MNSLVTRSAPRPRASAPELAAKVLFLADPQSYPEATGRVDTIETHMSWVFLTDRHAWKLKKPVRQSHLDFSTEAARRRNCAEELRLNRRLAQDVYLEVVPLTVDADGRLRLGPGGTVVDWLVKMRRLPAERMLDRMIRAGTVHAEDVRRIVGRLCRFYRECAPVAMGEREYRERFAAGIADNLAELGAGGIRAADRAHRADLRAAAHLSRARGGAASTRGSAPAASSRRTATCARSTSASSGSRRSSIAWNSPSTSACSTRPTNSRSSRSNASASARRGCGDPSSRPVPISPPTPRPTRSCTSIRAIARASARRSRSGT